MKILNQIIENHYLKEQLFEDIVDRLTAQGIDLKKVTRADISGVDEFHVRGAAVSKELAGTVDLQGAHILDVGCGIGGPCRMLVDEFDCKATGIDLSHEFVRTATELSKLVGLDDKTTFLQGDAANLPFKDRSFEVVWTQHVQMNIPNKMQFYSEINRVLKPGGHLLYYDIFKNDTGEVQYPMPWATSNDQSFLFGIGNLTQIFDSLGLLKVQTIDQTQAGIDFFIALFDQLKKSGPPKMGLNVLMGETAKPKLMNLLTHLKKGILCLQSGVYQKRQT